ncbi:hypothetical protein M5D96_004805 [Drosophila gunungcola]|uniref:Uncharacterized protein n=1 Tax=Drosophila gunungcola TaxID=103775 RepID=A0A9P9YUR2_9MUSC|nr:hypothetical protein M5D96_004805 [Drosophila gunungcola]
MADNGGPGSKHKDPRTIDAGGGGGAAGAGTGDDVPPVPAVRRRRAHEQKSSREHVEEKQKEEVQGQESQQLETSTVTRTYMKTITTSLTTSSSSNVEEFVLEEPSLAAAPSPNQQRLRQKVAQYEKVWSSDGSHSVKRPADQSADELRLADDEQGDQYDAENPFDIDVHEIERRLRQERQRGLAEAEAAKLAFQQVQLRHTTPPRRVEVTSDQVASPFNVTLRTTSRMSPGAEQGNVEEHLAPFNVTLRTTRRGKKKEIKELESFLEGERTVREVPSADGVRTIITSSMTSDGGYAEEKIYRHGEGYVSPRDSPSWSRSSYSSERSSVTPPRSVDLTAGGRRILIKLEQESELIEADSQQRDETDSFGRQEVAMATGNIDITVGGSNPRLRLYQQTTVQMGGGNTTTPADELTPQRPRPRDLALGTSTNVIASTTKTMLTSTPIGTKEQPQTGPNTPVSPAATCQLRGSSTEEPRKIVSHKTITSTTTKSTSSSSSSTSTSRKLIELSSSPVVGNISQIRTENNDIDIDNDSDTEGRPASSIVIVSTPTRPTTPASASVSVSAFATPSASVSASAAHALSGIGTFSKSLRQDYQTLATQSGRSNESPSEQEYQEFQSTMASINYARSNSQYDSHIKEKRGKNRE